MKKNKKAGLISSLLASAAMTITGCGPRCVYGPAPEEPGQSIDTQQDTTTDVINVQTLTDEPPACVYGPAPDWNDEEAPSDADPTTNE